MLLPSFLDRRVKVLRRQVVEGYTLPLIVTM
jgi:hypothetical protein